MFRPKFWKPGTEGPGMQEERDTSSEMNVVPYNRFQSLSMTQQRQRLPVFNFRNHILYLVSTYKVSKAFTFCKSILSIFHAHHIPPLKVTRLSFLCKTLKLHRYFL